MAFRQRSLKNKKPFQVVCIAGGSSNGRTCASGAQYLGSSPSPPAFFLALFCNAILGEPHRDWNFGIIEVMIPTVYFVSGVCGVGKSSIMPYLKELLPADNYDVRDFDERGVPDGADSNW